MRDRLLIGAGLFVGISIAVAIYALDVFSQSTPQSPSVSSPMPSSTRVFLSSNSEQDAFNPEGQVVDSIVWIEVQRADGTSPGYASGVVVGDDRVLTAWHVIDIAASATVTLKCCDTYPVQGVVAVDEVQDLALLVVDLPDDHTVAVPIAQQVPEDGDLVTVNMVMPRLGVAFSTKPVLSVREVPGNGLRLRSPTPSLPGSSGSPVINAEGQLVAIIHGAGGAGTTTCAVCTSDIIPAESAVIPLAEYASRDIDDLTRARRLWHKASRLRRDNKYAQAQSLLEQIVALDPNHWHGWLNLGICLDMLGDQRGALGPIRRSIEIEPFHGEAHYSLALVLLKTRQMEEAIPSFLKAIELDPEYDKPRGMLAVAYYQTGNLQAAIIHGRRAFELKPSGSEHSLNLARFLEEAGKEAEAADVLEQFCAEEKGHAQHLKRLGGLCFALEQAARAESAYRRAYDLNQTDAGAVVGLSLALTAQGRFDEAEGLLDKYEETAQRPRDVSNIRSLIQRTRSERSRDGGG